MKMITEKTPNVPDYAVPESKSNGLPYEDLERAVTLGVVKGGIILAIIYGLILVVAIFLHVGT
jgi:hypothetical protein